MNFILKYIIPILLFFITFLLFIIFNIISIFLYPTFRIAIRKEVIFELPIKIKAIKIGFFLRDPVENILENKLLFFTKKPYFLYVNKKYINQLPKNIYNHENISYSIKQKQMLIATFETRKLWIWQGYAPAKLISYRIVDEKPIFIK